ncbi:trypsin delta [Monomorium pharaonis]|uniref:trypsin delta n=1 Tax=Monomorium pharaonis TaxID=307658 RepID=UPI001746BDDC|nr:trypsin delta [Monomorium pharaonis]
MREAVVILYFAGFLLGKTNGNAILKAQPKIVGGQSIDIKYRPFMLSLHNSYGFLCGASILSRTWAITALHCLVSVSSTQYYVRAGSNKANKGGSVHRVTNIHIYNDTYRSWFSRLLHHDIALIEVKPPFRFSKTVRPARLPRSNHEVPRELLVCGWGDINEKEESPQTLMGVYIQHVPFETCVNITTSYAILVKDDYHLCYGTQGKDACFGDSGGPLASKRTIYGIVSFGRGCGKVAGVYVKVSYYRDWIKAVTNL